MQCPPQNWYGALLVLILVNHSRIVKNTGEWQSPQRCTTNVIIGISSFLFDENRSVSFFYLLHIKTDRFRFIRVISVFPSHCIFSPFSLVVYPMKVLKIHQGAISWWYGIPAHWLMSRGREIGLNYKMSQQVVPLKLNPIRRLTPAGSPFITQRSCLVHLFVS